VHISLENLEQLRENSLQVSISMTCVTNERIYIYRLVREEKLRTYLVDAYTFPDKTLTWNAKNTCLPTKTFTSSC